MCTYLALRKATYCFRRPVPLDVRAAIKRTEWMYSLRTKNRAEAKRLVPAETIRTDALIDAARAASPAVAFDAIDASVMTYLGEKYQCELLSADDAVRYGQAPDPRTPRERRKWHQANEDGYQSAREDNDLASIVGIFGPEAARLAAVEALHLDPTSADYRRLAEKLFHVRADVAEQVVARDNGRGTLTPTAPLRVDGQLTAQPVVSSGVGTGLMALFDAYVAERKPSPSTVGNWRPYMSHLIKFLGHDDANAITSRDMIRWKDALLREPNHKGKPLAASTVGDGYLAAMRAVFRWAQENERILVNPASKVRVRKPKAVQLRDRGFTDPEASTILRAALVPATEALSAEHALARRWVPWLLAFTGARASEIGQLRKQDVRQEDGHWVLRITPEAGTVKDSSARLVPVHPQLIELGFAAMITAQDEGHIFYDQTAQRKPGVDARPYRKVGERIGKWVRSIGIDDPAIQPNHAWRHRFKTTARLVGMDPSARDVIQGHAAKSEGEKYGHYPLATLAAEIAKLPYFKLGPVG